jgi:hypothetical protein
MNTQFAIAATRLWTRLYTAGLPREVRESRRAEIESDIWESLHDPTASGPQILLRLAAGVLDDVSWRAGYLPHESRTVGMTIGTGALMLAAMWQWLAQSAASNLILESAWLYPIVESLHVLVITIFLGLTIILDLRLLGLSMRRVPITELTAQVLPWAAPTALLTLATGMLLFITEPERFAMNVFFQVKAAALVLAVLNLLVFHLFIYSRVGDWDHQGRPPLAARLSAACSLTLWSVILITSRLIAYNWFG